MDLNTIPSHLGDSEILRLIDGEGEARELEGWAGHVAECGPCSARLESQRDDARRVRVALSEVRLPAGFPSADEAVWRVRRARHEEGPGARGGGPQRRWLRAAAVVLLLLLPFALVSPIRAAVFEWLRQGWSSISGGTAEPEAPAAPASAATVGSGFKVWFTPAGETVDVVLQSRQATGTLTVGTTEGPEGSLEILEGAAESALVTDAGVTVRNAASSRASYRITVPGGVASVRVRVGDEAVLSLPRAELTPERSVDISR